MSSNGEPGRTRRRPASEPPPLPLLLPWNHRMDDLSSFPAQLPFVPSGHASDRPSPCPMPMVQREGRLHSAMVASGLRCYDFWRFKIESSITGVVAGEDVTPHGSDLLLVGLAAAATVEAQVLIRPSCIHLLGLLLSRTFPPPISLSPPYRMVYLAR